MAQKMGKNLYKCAFELNFASAFGCEFSMFKKRSNFYVFAAAPLDKV
jgi:hypothetical protein